MIGFSWFTPSPAHHVCQISRGADSIEALLWASMIIEARVSDSIAGPMYLKLLPLIL